jgi:hypothetical protein
MDDETDRHGTLVAGIIGADGDNGLGITGVNRVASMMALKFLGPDGSGTTDAAVRAIEFAIQAKAVLGSDANVRILNNSWGSNSFSQLLFDEIKAASNNNMLTVASAGNEGANNDVTPHYPSGFNDPNIYILSVAATDNRDVISSFSNFGATTVHLAAPGQDIASVRPPKTYVFESGTSVSTAVVSGAAALVLSGCNLSTAQLRANLLFSVDVLPTLQGRMTSNGRLNVFRSLQACAGNTPPSFTLKSSSSFVPAVPGGSASTTAISITPLNGFTSDVNLTASAPLGFNVSLGSPVLTTGVTSTSVNVTVDAGVAAGAYVIHVTGTGGGLQRTAGLTVMVGAPVALDQNIEQAWTVQGSEPNRFSSVITPGFADWYQLSLNSTRDVNIALNYQIPQSGIFLRLLNSSGSVLAATQTVVSNTLQISQSNLNAGAYFIVASTGTPSPSPYSLAVNAPLLRQISPNGGEQGATVNVTLSGSQFAPGLTVDAGAGISVTNVVFNNAQSASATFSISSNAALGDRTVRVSTSGTSNGVTFAVRQATPTITSVTPSSGVVGTSVDITILGSNFINPTVSVTSFSPQTTIDNIVVVSTTTITARLTIPPNALIQSISIRVNTSGGTVTRAFGILPLPPTLSSITPLSGSLGSTVDVVLAGTNFLGTVNIDAGSGIQVTNLVVTGTTATARFNISRQLRLGLEM